MDTESTETARHGTAPEEEAAAAPRPRRGWGAGAAGAVICLLFVGVASVARMISPYPYTEQLDGDALAAPSRIHPFGTDELNRDILSRTLVGAQYSLVVGVSAIAMALALALPLGLTTGWFGGFWDTLVMRTMDLIMAFPAILLAIGVVAFLSPTLFNLLLAIAIVNLPPLARQVRAGVLTLRSREFVEASRALGAGPWRIMGTVLLPNLMGPVIVLAALGIGTAILEAAGLGFVGLWVEPKEPEWGNMLSNARAHMTDAPWAVLAPGMALTLAVLGFNLLGEGLRARLDPKSRLT